VRANRGLATLGANGITDVLRRNLALATLLVCVGELMRNQIVTVIGLMIISQRLSPRLPGGPESRSPPPARRRSGRRPRRHPRLSTQKAELVFTKLWAESACFGYSETGSSGPADATAPGLRAKLAATA
jgi:hypothetical protein